MLYNRAWYQVKSIHRLLCYFIFVVKYIDFQQFIRNTYSVSTETRRKKWLARSLS